MEALISLCLTGLSERRLDALADRVLSKSDTLSKRAPRSLSVLSRHAQTDAQSLNDALGSRFGAVGRDSGTSL